MTEQILTPCRLAALVTDPEITGDRLALGAALAHHCDHLTRAERQAGKGVGQIGRLAFGPRRHAVLTVKSVIRDDTRRYEPPQTYSGACGAPMIRRDGLCGKPATGRGLLWDWEDTGEAHEINACSRHRDWLRDAVQRNRRARPEHPATPCANAGGHLRRHFPEIDWAKLYSWASYRPDGWVEPPEREPIRRPTLTILTGDDMDDDETDSAARPALQVIGSPLIHELLASTDGDTRRG